MSFVYSGGETSTQPPLTATEEAMDAIIDDVSIKGIAGMQDTKEVAAEEAMGTV